MAGLMKSSSDGKPDSHETCRCGNVNYLLCTSGGEMDQGGVIPMLAGQTGSGCGR